VGGKIAVFDTKPYDRHALDLANKEVGLEITYFEAKLTKETAPLTNGFQVICLFVHDFVDKELMHTLYDNGVRLIALRSNGYNHIDVESSWGKIRIVHVPKYSPYSVAEFTIALMLALNRKLYLSFNRTRTNNFSLIGLEGFDMHGKTAGVVGAGQIGSIVVRLLTAFGIKVYVHDNWVNEALVHETKCIYTDMNTLYKESDIITLHCPLTSNTHHMINYASINLMKENALLINTSRGGLIRTHDLVEGLKSKKIAGAALDVYEEEERFFFEDLSDSFIDDDVLARIMTFPNVIVTAHQAFFTKEALKQIADTTLNNVHRFYSGRELVNEIKPR
jgi:D-lactate dehydrogenase